MIPHWSYLSSKVLQDKRDEPFRDDASRLVFLIVVPVGDQGVTVAAGLLDVIDAIGVDGLPHDHHDEAVFADATDTSRE
ncbi:hypothetical protein H2198_005797 [Neophaeococcomyces mojaviensis]|uniref:Uncharacterized protein n=1 Tax=Neophaeococcomyces mojaviensis TaxID=3383035 RepID=A0ACC3A4Q2_9EURO|nr:hypothetical protein H2198_005797 [Knufia sp. JES_112]